MAKRKVKKVKTAVDSVTKEKIEKINILLQSFKAQTVLFENCLNSDCVTYCNKIDKLYGDRIKSIPENIRTMTIAEYVAMQEKQVARETECPKNEMAFRIQHERQKMLSEKKTTHRKEKKRSISVPVSARGLASNRNPKNSNFPGLSRNVSELSLITPVTKQKKSMIVTPKFDPSRPIVKARKPKPGEVIMSISGSPLQVPITESGTSAAKTVNNIAVSLGHGKIIIDDDGAIEIEKELLKKIDEPLKNTLQDVQKKLKEILQSK